MASRSSDLLLAAALLAASARGVGGEIHEPRSSRLESIEEEIDRLEGELRTLEGRKRGILGEVERLTAELLLKRAELREIDVRLASTARALEATGERRDALRAAQQERRVYLAFRLRETYKHGAGQELRRLVGGEESDAYVRALAYASFLSARDARVLAEYDASAAELAREEERLEEQRKHLGELKDRAESTRGALEAKRVARARALEGMEVDSRKRVEALRELEAAAAGLSDLVGRLERRQPRSLDIRKFRGLLDWPVPGEVTAGFGNAVHPRFRTVVPHPGLDLDSPEGTPFRSVFDGRVAFAAWLHGYGLTAIVDHGGGIVSVYAHASAVLVERGEEVARGQVLGRVGDTGSLRGSYLYFEIRKDGKAEDPAAWLRKR
jgi:septal ring factor EnvC (AmiA/AmiB activator)